LVIGGGGWQHNAALSADVVVSKIRLRQASSMYHRDSMSWDPHQLRLNEGAIGRSPSNPPPGRRTSSIEGKFIAGPIDVAWVIQAAQLGVKALLLGMVLWHLKGLRKCHTFKVSNLMVREWGITSDAKSRGLRKLERIGLIAVQRQGKRSPQVTIKRANTRQEFLNDCPALGG
jgi:hypothetical protein